MGWLSSCASWCPSDQGWVFSELSDLRGCLGSTTVPQEGGGVLKEGWGLARHTVVLQEPRGGRGQPLRHSLLWVWVPPGTEVGAPRSQGHREQTDQASSFQPPPLPVGCSSTLPGCGERPEQSGRVKPAV